MWSAESTAKYEVFYRCFLPELHGCTSNILQQGTLCVLQYIVALAKCVYLLQKRVRRRYNAKTVLDSQRAS
jgi:hypothetical protein